MFFCFVEYYILHHFLCEEHNKKLTTLQIFCGENSHNVLRNFLLYVYYSIMIHSKNSAKKWPRKWYRNITFS